MTVLAAAANRQAKGAPKTRRFLMAASQTIYKGAIVHMNSSGLAIPASDTASQVVVGIAAETMISAATGNFWIQVEYDREYLFAASSITQAMVGTNMVTVDDNTVDDIAGATNDIVVGKLTEFVSTTSGWVHVPGLTATP